MSKVAYEDYGKLTSSTYAYITANRLEYYKLYDGVIFYYLPKETREEKRLRELNEEFKEAFV